MALISDVVTYCRQKAQTDSNGITDTLGLAFANDALLDMTRELLKRDIDAAQTQESFTNLTTNAPNTYAFPSDMYSLKTIEVNFTDGSQNNYLQAQAVEVANLQNMSFDYLRLNQPTTSPLFDNRGDVYEIFPTPKIPITAGIKMFYFLTPTEYTATSNTIAYPQSLDYRCLGAFMLANYYESLEKVDMAQVWMARYKERLNGIINILAPSSQQPIQPTPLQISGWQF